ncbi:unnamed protein product [Cunninghamella echinulata]
MATESITVHQYLDKLLLGIVENTIKNISEQFKEETWSSEKISKLKEIAWSKENKNGTTDWKYISYYLDMSPGSCYRKWCSFISYSNRWTLQEDIQLLCFLNETILNPDTISKTITTRTNAGIQDRITRLGKHNLYTFDLYFGQVDILDDITNKSPTIKNYQLPVENYQTPIKSYQVLTESCQFSTNNYPLLAEKKEESYGNEQSKNDSNITETKHESDTLNEGNEKKLADENISKKNIFIANEKESGNVTDSTNNEAAFEKKVHKKSFLIIIKKR